jgi:hypothetical protein
MHAVAVKRELSAKHPELVKAVYFAFCESKQACEAQYVKGMTFNNMTMMISWFSQLVTENRALLGHDWWPYGIKANRKSLDAYLRYHSNRGSRAGGRPSKMSSSPNL